MSHRIRTYINLNSEDGDEGQDGDEGDTHHHVHHHTHHHHAEGSHHDSHPVSHPAMAAVQERMGNPPPTWAAYEGHPDGLRSIIDMEKHELAQAQASGNPLAIKKELTDLAAACICALKSM